MNIIYTALFVKNSEELLKIFPPKHDNVFAHHSTIKFKPQNLDCIEVGREIKVKVLGRVYNDKGDALLVENKKSENRYPHITISCANGVMPKYSNEMIEKSLENNKVEYFNTPIYIEMIEGYFNGLEDVI